MQRLTKLLVLSAFIVALFGCAAAMVPATDDPAKKLGWATELLERQDRPLPAERLIREAIEIYTAQNNENGLAEGYRKYGVFYRSYTVKKWEDVYRKDGFLDKTVTFDQRLDKSLEYFAKSRELYAKTKTYDMLSNIDLNTAWVYEEIGANKLACTALDSSLENNVLFSKKEPDTKIRLTGFKTYGEFIASEKKRVKCL